ncbi:MAG: hypothetical protein ACM3NF_06385 [Gemmatimonadota bacterium]
MSNSRSRKIPPLRRLLAFPSLRPARVRGAVSPSESEVLFELEGRNPGNRLFGRYGPDDVRDRLDRAGILEGLARRGFRDPTLVLSCEEPADQRVFLFAGQATRDRLLLEARLKLCLFRPRRAIGPLAPESTFRILIIEWLVLSDPDRPFTFDRPRLPGQERPGLGLLSPCLLLLRDMARELLLDGVLDVPDHYHTALLYARRMHFLEPDAEGRLLAIARDLKGVPLALASDAIREGCLVDRATGLALPWQPSEQLLAVRGPLRSWFRSAEYARARDRACEGLRVAVDWDGYRARIATRGLSAK